MNNHLLLNAYTGGDGLGRLFIKLGRWDKVQEVYEAMPKTTSNTYKKANLYNQLGRTKDN